MTRSLIACAFLMSASAASANGSVVFHYEDPPTANVTTRDVDLGTAFGRVIVERRIQLAARGVCADANDNDVFGQSNRLFRDCYNRAMSSGVTQLEQLAGK